MSIERARFNALVSAAAGDDPALVAELRQSVIDSAHHHADLMQRSRCDGNWAVSTRRLKGLADTFGLDDLGALAERALRGAPGDPRVLGEIALHIGTLRV